MADESSTLKLSKNAKRNQFKTPRLYKEAAKIIREVEKNQQGYKNCLFKAKHTNKGVLTALVCKILQRRSVLDHVIAAAGLDKEEQVDMFLLKVLVHEQLYRKKTLSCRSKTVLLTQQKHDALHHAFTQYQQQQWKKGKDAKDWIAIPRYARVNLLKATLEEVVLALESYGFVKVEYDPEMSYHDYIKLVEDLGEEQFLHDLHVENLLVFHQKINFFNYWLYNSGKLLLQDKASCLPAICLNPPHDSFVLDACAAPGMKTTHLASLMNNTGEILAMDVCEKRASTLTNILHDANVTNATVKVEDFTTVDVSKKPYCLVDHILVDPSCSGSGIVKRYTLFEEQPKGSDATRLGPLTTFQTKMLLKALSFPNVKRVVYSTCSIHKWENEEVVNRALQNSQHRFKLVGVSEQRGWPFINADDMGYPRSRSKCIRTVPKRDLMNGFFVAVMERMNEEECVEDPPAEAVAVNGKTKAKKARKMRNGKTFGSSKVKGKKGTIVMASPPCNSDNIKPDVAIEELVEIDGDAKSTESVVDRKSKKGRMIEVVENKNENGTAVAPSSSPAKKKIAKKGTREKPKTAKTKKKKITAKGTSKRKKAARLSVGDAAVSPLADDKSIAAKDSPKEKKATLLSVNDVAESPLTAKKVETEKRDSPEKDKTALLSVDDAMVSPLKAKKVKIAKKDILEKDKTSLLPVDDAVESPPTAKKKKLAAKDTPKKKKIADLSVDDAMESPLPTKRKKTSLKSTPRKKKKARLSEVDVEGLGGKTGKLQRRKSVA